MLVLVFLIVATKLFIEPGTKAPIPKAFERERPRIVNNFAASASPMPAIYAVLRISQIPT
jgi:hypothetical protein